MKILKYFVVGIFVISLILLSVTSVFAESPAQKPSTYLNVAGDVTILGYNDNNSSIFSFSSYSSTVTYNTWRTSWNSTLNSIPANLRRQGTLFNFTWNPSVDLGSVGPYTVNFLYFYGDGTQYVSTPLIASNGQVTNTSFTISLLHDATNFIFAVGNVNAEFNYVDSGFMSITPVEADIIEDYSATASWSSDGYSLVVTPSSTPATRIDNIVVVFMDRKEYAGETAYQYGLTYALGMQVARTGGNLNQFCRSCNISVGSQNISYRSAYDFNVFEYTIPLGYQNFSVYSTVSYVFSMPDSVRLSSPYVLTFTSNFLDFLGNKSDMPKYASVDDTELNTYESVESGLLEAADFNNWNNFFDSFQITTIIKPMVAARVILDYFLAIPSVTSIVQFALIIGLMAFLLNITWVFIPRGKGRVNHEHHPGKHKGGTE